MATYEDDHNLPPSSTTSTPNPNPTTSSPPRPSTSTSTSRRHRLNISDFFSSSSRTPSNPDTIEPGDVPAAFRSLAAAFSELAMTPVMEGLIETLRAEAENPDIRRAVGGGAGVPEGWTDGLERVGKGGLRKDDICSICNTPFLDDPYPLVVRLPCHESHIFDLECIQPWLKLHSTCPLDRTDLLKKKEPPAPPPPADEEEEEEWDDNYG